MKEYIVPVNNTDRNDDEIFVGFIRKRKELIRCKDCRYYGNAQIGNNVALTNFCSLLKDCRREEDFCSRAEKKEE